MSIHRSASEVMKIAGGDFLPQSVIDWSTIDVSIYISISNYLYY